MAKHLLFVHVLSIPYFELLFLTLCSSERSIPTHFLVCLLFIAYLRKYIVVISTVHAKTIASVKVVVKWPAHAISYLLTSCCIMENIAAMSH